MQRFTVQHIDIETARKALALDAHKTPEQIRLIADKRGLEALAQIDAAMTVSDFGQDSVGASVEALRLQNDPSIFEVVGIKYHGAVVTGGFDWDVH